MATYQFWIVEIVASEKVINKIADADHGHLTLSDVQSAVALKPDLEGRWLAFDAVRGGRRLMVEGIAGSGKTLRVILGSVDIDNGVWNLRTAYRIH